MYSALGYYAVQARITDLHRQAQRANLARAARRAKRRAPSERARPGRKQ